MSVQPLVVARGLNPSLALGLSGCGGFLFAIFVFASLVQVTDGTLPFTNVKLPWIAHDSGRFLDHNAWVPWTIIAVSLVVATALLWRVLRRRAGTVWFFESHILVSGGELFNDRDVDWAAIASFRDDSAAYVELVPHVGWRILVPTRTEETRQAVLDLLAKKGLARA